MKLMLFQGNKKKDMERRFTTFSEQLAQAFAQIKTDMQGIHSRLDDNKTEIERIGQWVGYLNRHSQRLSDHNSKLSQKFEKIAENHQKLHSSHTELVQHHQNTARTAETTKNSHQELSGTVSAHQDALKSELKSEFHTHLSQHKEDHEDEIRRLKAWVDYFATYVDRQKGKEEALKQDLSKAEANWLETYSKLRELVNGIKSENSEVKHTVSGFHSEFENVKEQLRSAISELESTKNELSSTKSSLDSTQEALENTRNMAESIKSRQESESSAPVQQVQQPIPQQVQPQPQVFTQVSPPATSFQRHIMSRVMPNRKGYVLKFMLNLIDENQHSTKEIEEIVVNEKQLCGRTSFYAYLKELKLKGRIGYAEIDDRTILVCTDSQQKLSDRLDQSLDEQ
jgi:chromosome segregation ATPase